MGTKVIPAEVLRERYSLRLSTVPAGIQVSCRCPHCNLPLGGARGLTLTKGEIWAIPIADGVRIKEFRCDSQGANQGCRGGRGKSFLLRFCFPANGGGRYWVSGVRSCSFLS